MGKRLKRSWEEPWGNDISFLEALEYDHLGSGDSRKLKCLNCGLVKMRRQKQPTAGTLIMCLSIKAPLKVSYKLELNKHLYFSLEASLIVNSP